MPRQSQNNAFAIFAILLGAFVLALMLRSLPPVASNGGQKILTGKWALHVNDAPEPSSYIQISRTGNVTGFSPDGSPTNWVAGYTEQWTVKDDLIESVSRQNSSLMESIREIPERIAAANRDDSAMKFRFECEGDSIIHMGSPTAPQQPAHKVTLKRYVE